MKIIIACRRCEGEIYEVTKYKPSISGTLIHKGNLFRLNAEKLANNIPIECGECGAWSPYIKKTNGDIIKYEIIRIKNRRVTSQ